MEFESSDAQIDMMVEYSNNEGSESREMLKFPRPCSLSHLMEMDYMGPVSHLLSENCTYDSTFDFPNNIGYNTGRTDDHVEKLEVGEISNYQYSDSEKFQVMNQSQQVYMNPNVFEFH